MNNILIIDDNETLRRSLELSLTEEGYEVSTAGTGREGLRMLREGFAELVLVDLKLPDANGIDVLRKVKEATDDTIVVVITAYGEVDTAVEAMKLGAYDYINKPFEFEAIKITLKKALEKLNLKKQMKRDFGRFDNIIGESDGMRSVFDTIDKIVRSEATTVLIQSETGTGKGLIARTIHGHSTRRDRPFVEINCSSIPENLVESELFGYEGGAFTGASKLKKGLVEQADGGTLFLDEIGDLAPDAQVKLLKVIDEKVFRRLGGIRDIQVDVRIMAATNRNLRGLVEEKLFRDDLYYRLTVVPVIIPPLRERTEDIPLIADYFLEKYCQEFKKKRKSLSQDAVKKLIQYGWPGNVRELKNTIERVCLLEDAEIITSDLITLRTGTERPPEDSHPLKAGELTLEEMEKAYIEETLRENANNKSRAAKILGISRHTLRRKLEKY
jgi:DNA-binding NtrC family response regulator